MNATTRPQGDAHDPGTGDGSGFSAPPQPRQLGRYLVIEPLGHGGMGIVLRAYDPKLQREVALKLLKTPDPASRARMVREARAMAKLNHPNVVAVYDVDPTDDGDVVVAMELVRGKTLAQWLTGGHERREVIERFAAAGLGLSAAHDAGLLHRDFKPSNVLIGDDGRVRVTDFGLARPEASDDDTSDRIVGAVETSHLFVTGIQVTEDGTVLGTPPYMAPEQHVPGPLTTAADQYAFCVALWEALTGRLPFRGRGDALLAAKLAGPPDDVAVDRVLSAVRRGLSVDPARRWPSMPALLAELTHDTARPRSYRTLAAGAILVALGAAAFAGLERRDAVEPCRSAAEHIAAVLTPEHRERIGDALSDPAAPHLAALAPRVIAGLDEYSLAWQAAHTEACEATRVRGEQSEALLDLRMACFDRAKTGLGATVELLAEGRPEILVNAPDVVAALPALSRCDDADALRSEVAPPDAQVADRVEQARRDLARARALREAASYADALALVERTRVEIATVAYAPLVTEAAFERGAVHEGLGQWAEARSAYLEAVRSGAAEGQWTEVGAAMCQLAYVVGVREARLVEATGWLELARGLAVRSSDETDDATVHNVAGLVLRGSGDNVGAEAEHRAALAIRERLFGTNHPAVAQSLTNLAVALDGRDEFDEAERAFERALAVQTEVWGAAHPTVARARHGLAGILHHRGEHVQAEAEYRTAIRIKRDALGPEHPDVATSLANLGGTLVDQGRYSDARREFTEAMRILVAANGPDHPDVAGVRANMAEVLHVLGDDRAAAAECRAAMLALEKRYGPDHPQVAATRINLANLLDELGETEDAMREYIAATASLEASLGPTHLHVGAAHHNLATAQESNGEFADAEASYRRALAIRETGLGKDHPLVAETLAAMVDVLNARGRKDEARAALERAWEIRRQRDTPPEVRGRTAFDLARLLWRDRSQRDRAIELARRAREAYAQAETADDEQLASVDRWLADPS